jgi:hypothetical protein
VFKIYSATIDVANRLRTLVEFKSLNGLVSRADISAKDYQLRKMDLPEVCRITKKLQLQVRWIKPRSFCRIQPQILPKINLIPRILPGIQPKVTQHAIQQRSSQIQPKTRLQILSGFNNPGSRFVVRTQSRIRPKILPRYTRT